MKATIITINFLLSLMSLSITDESPLWEIFAVAGYFGFSLLLMVYAHRKGWLKGVYKRCNLDEL